jgi:hypothetical protein
LEHPPTDPNTLEPRPQPGPRKCPLTWVDPTTPEQTGTVRNTQVSSADILQMFARPNEGPTLLTGGSAASFTHVRTVTSLLAVIALRTPRNLGT